MEVVEEHGQVVVQAPRRPEPDVERATRHAFDGAVKKKKKKKAILNFPPLLSDSICELTMDCDAAAVAAVILRSHS